MSISLAGITKATADSSYAPPAYGLSVGRGLAVVPVGLHTKTNAQGLSNGTDTSTTYRDFYPLTDPKVGAVLPGFNNWYAAADVVGPNSITVSAAVECSDGTIVPFTFAGGSHTVVIPPGGLVFPDAPIGFGAQSTVNDATTGTALPLKGVWIRTYVVVTAGQKWPVGIDSREASGSASTTGTGADLTTTGSGAVSGGASAYMYGPCVILARSTARKPIVALIGDSQLEGANDGNPTTNASNQVTRGYGERVCEALGYPMVKFAKGGEAASNFSVPLGRKYRAAMFDGCTHALVNYGTNDLVSNGRTAVQCEADLLAIWTYLSGLGIKVWQTTITPRTTSTDTWTTSGNQTASGAGGTTDPTRLAAVNAYIRAQAGGAVLSGYIEVGGAVSTALDSGLWASNVSASGAGLTVTNDGTHMSPYCIKNTVQPLVQAVAALWTV